MAARRKPKAKKLRFELTKSAIAGIGVVSFCLFIWMFLLGVWVGQSILFPSYQKNSVAAKKSFIKLRPLVIRAEKKIVKKLK